MQSIQNEIWTIGHSTRSLEDFIEMLKSYEIDFLADVRRFPGSRKFPHFNKEELEAALKENNINYLHLESLGGRRKVLPGSHNTAWRLASFQGYADHMQTEEFKMGIYILKDKAQKFRLAYMCSEAVWWSCHRSLISDQLKAEGWKVNHIMSETKEMEHPYTKPARIIEGKLSYKGNEE